MKYTLREVCRPKWCRCYLECVPKTVFRPLCHFATWLLREAFRGALLARHRFSRHGFSLNFFLALSMAAVSSACGYNEVHQVTLSKNDTIQLNRSAQPLLEALERYYSIHGLYPEHVRTLVPEYLSADTSPVNQIRVKELGWCLYNGSNPRMFPFTLGECLPRLAVRQFFESEVVPPQPLTGGCRTYLEQEAGDPQRRLEPSKRPPQCSEQNWSDIVHRCTVQGYASYQLRLGTRHGWLTYDSSTHMWAAKELFTE